MRDRRRTFRQAMPVIVIILLLAMTLAAWQDISARTHSQARAIFVGDCAAKFEAAQRGVEATFNLTYDVLRNMAILPGVVRIDRYAKNLEGDHRTTIPDLYGMLVEHVSASEIYIVPAGMDPDRIDPVTGKPETPIITFDDLVASRPAGGHAQEERPEPKEEEIFEYREMKRQCEYFRQRYPTRSHVKGNAFPAPRFYSAVYKHAWLSSI